MTAHCAAPMMTDEELAARWFYDLTKPQLATYNARMSVASAYRGSPRWDREQMTAKRAWESSTSEARRIYEMAMHDLATIGEISEGTLYEFEELTVAQAMQAAE